MKIALLIGCFCVACTLGCGKPVAQPAPAIGTLQKSVGPTTERIQQIVAEQMGVDRAKLTGQTSLGDLGADELDFVELVMELEEEFDVSIPDESAEQLMGSKDWEQGMKNVTLAKLATLVDERKKLPRVDSTGSQ